MLGDKNYFDNDSLDLRLKPNHSSNFFHEVDTFSSDINNTTENLIKSKCYDFNQLPTLKEFTGKNYLSLFYPKTCSLPKNIDDLEHLIQSTKTDFDIIAISESRLIKLNSHQSRRECSDLAHSNQEICTQKCFSTQRKIFLYLPKINKFSKQNIFPHSSKKIDFPLKEKFLMKKMTNFAN